MINLANRAAYIVHFISLHFSLDSFSADFSLNIIMIFFVCDYLSETYESFRESSIYTAQSSVRSPEEKSA